MKYDKILAPVHKYVLDQRLEQFLTCERCRLCPAKNDEATHVVPGRGNLNAKVMILAEAPGFYEDQTGFPLVGPSFKLLEWLKNDLGFDIDNDFFITNAVFCRPPQNRTPYKSELDACWINLQKIIDMMPNLKIILCVGGTALKQVEGESSVLSTRQLTVGKVTIGSRTIFTLSVKHPAYILRIKSYFGKQRAIQEYLQQLHFFRQVVDKAESGRIDFHPPYQYHIAQTEAEAFDWADFLLNDPEVIHIAADFETLGIKSHYAEPISISISWKDYHAVTIPFKQRVNLPKSRYYKIKGKNGKPFTMKWHWVPWFSKDFEQKFMQKLRPLFESEAVTGYKRKPFLSGWHTQFEDNVCLYNYGYHFAPRQEQLPRPKNGKWSDNFEDWEFDLDVPLFDGMVAARLINNTLHSLKLESVIKWIFPLEAETKEKIEKILTKPQIQETGYGLAMVKDENDPEYIAKEFNKPRWFVLCERGNFDADIERRIIGRIADMLRMGTESMMTDYLKEINESEIWI